MTNVAAAPVDDADVQEAEVAPPVPDAAAVPDAPAPAALADVHQALLHEVAPIGTQPYRRPPWYEQ